MLGSYCRVRWRNNVTCRRVDVMRNIFDDCTHRIAKWELERPIVFRATGKQKCILLGWKRLGKKWFIDDRSGPLRI